MGAVVRLPKTFGDRALGQVPVGGFNGRGGVCPIDPRAESDRKRCGCGFGSGPPRNASQSEVSPGWAGQERRVCPIVAIGRTGRLSIAQRRGDPWDFAVAKTLRPLTGRTLVVLLGYPSKTERKKGPLPGGPRNGGLPVGLSFETYCSLLADAQPWGLVPAACATIARLQGLSRGPPITARDVEPAHRGRRVFPIVISPSWVRTRTRTHVRKEVRGTDGESLAGRFLSPTGTECAQR